MIKNKRGGVGKEWIFTLAFLFSLTVLVFIFNGVFNYNLAPLFIDMMPDTPAGDAAIAGINQWLMYWKFIPLLIFGSAIVYMLILTVKRSPEERYIG